METRSYDPRRQREMREFWDRLRDERRAREGIDLPSFADFSLMDLPSHLIRGAMLIDLGVVGARAEAVGRPYFRFAGETYYNVLGFECTRHFLDELPLGEKADAWRDILTRVAMARAPLNGELAMRDGHGRLWHVHWARYPLSLDGRVVDMVLGYDVHLPVIDTVLPILDLTGVPRAK